MAAGAGIDRAVNAAYRHAGNVLAGAGTGIGDTGSDQALQRCGVPLVPVVLVDQFAIPFKTEGFKRGEDPAAGTGHFARRIEVFDPQPPFAAVAAGIQTAGYGGQQGACMQQAGRTGSKTAAVAADRSGSHG